MLSDSELVILAFRIGSLKSHPIEIPLDDDVTFLWMLFDTELAILSFRIGSTKYRPKNPLDDGGRFLRILSELELLRLFSD